MKLVTFVEGILNTNNYLLEEDGCCIVIDCSYGKNQVGNYILQNNLVLQGVLLTHGHFDHCGGVKKLLEMCGNVPLYVGKNDELLCNTAQGNMWHRSCDNCYPTNFFTEGKLQLGKFNFNITFAPGHTDGGVLISIDKYLFAGDTLFKGNIGRTDFAESNPNAMKTTLEKIMCLKNDYVVLPGHGESTTLDYEKKTNPYLKNYDIIY